MNHSDKNIAIEVIAMGLGNLFSENLIERMKIKPSSSISLRFWNCSLSEYYIACFKQCIMKHL